MVVVRRLQNTLFDFDKKAAEDSVNIGKAVRNATYSMIKPGLPEKRMRVYEVILQHPEGITRKEIARILRWPINCVTGRVTELRDKHGLIVETNTVPSPCYDGRMYPNGVLKPL